MGVFAICCSLCFFFLSGISMHSKYTRSTSYRLCDVRKFEPCLKTHLSPRDSIWELNVDISFVVVDRFFFRPPRRLLFASSTARPRLNGPGTCVLSLYRCSSSLIYFSHRVSTESFTLNPESSRVSNVVPRSKQSTSTAKFKPNRKKTLANRMKLLNNAAREAARRLYGPDPNDLPGYQPPPWKYPRTWR